MLVIVLVIVILLLAELIRDPRADLERLAQRITVQLVRNESSRLDHWSRHAGRLPPPRFAPT